MRRCRRFPDTPTAHRATCFPGARREPAFRQSQSAWCHDRARQAVLGSSSKHPRLNRIQDSDVSVAPRIESLQWRLQTLFATPEHVPRPDLPCPTFPCPHRSGDPLLQTTRFGRLVTLLVFTRRSEAPPHVGRDDVQVGVVDLCPPSRDSDPPAWCHPAEPGLVTECRIVNLLFHDAAIDE